MMVRTSCIFALAIFYISVGKTQTRTDTLRTIDSLVNEAMAIWNVPGVSLSIIKNKAIYTTKGYGVRNIETQAPVDKHTLFGIASCTKAFTAAGTALLVETGKLDWDRPLITYLSDFKMKDTFASRHIAMRDLLCHRSGLPRHDMIWHNSGLNRQQIYDRLRYLPSTQPLYKKFQYNNVMYIIAGVVLERISGSTYEEFITTELLQPLEMTETIWFDKELRRSKNFAVPYVLNGLGEPYPAPIFPHDDVTNAAGGIKTSARDMANWLLFQLNLGSFNGRSIISSHLVEEMHKGQILIREPNSSHSGTELYALGWNISRYKGRKHLSHQGARAGFWTHISMLPTDGFAIYVNSNIDGNSVYFVEMLALTLTDFMLNLEPTDWQSKFQKNQISMELRQKQRTKLKRPPKKPGKPLSVYVGQYQHPAFGTIVIRLQDLNLIAHFRQQEFVLKPQGDSRFGGQTSIDYIEFDFINTPDGIVQAIEGKLQGIPIQFIKVP